MKNKKRRKIYYRRINKLNNVCIKICTFDKNAKQFRLIQNKIKIHEDIYKSLILFRFFHLYCLPFSLLEHRLPFRNGAGWFESQAEVLNDTRSGECDLNLEQGILRGTSERKCTEGSRFEYIIDRSVCYLRRKYCSSTCECLENFI